MSRAPLEVHLLPFRAVPCADPPGSSNPVGLSSRLATAYAAFAVRNRVFWPDG